MHGIRAARNFHAALIALIGVLVMSVGAQSAYAGGRDHGNGPGQQNSVSVQTQQSQQSVQVQSDTQQSVQDQTETGKNCKKNETSTGEKTGEQTTVTPPTGTTGEQGKKGEENEQGEHAKNENEQGGHAKKENEEQAQGKQENAPSAPATTQAGQTAPAVVTTPAIPTPAPVQAQQAPTQGGQVQGETGQAPQETAQARGPAKQGGRVLAESATTTPTASQSGLARTGFDVRPLALLGVLCIAASALLLRRVRRS